MLKTHKIRCVCKLSQKKFITFANSSFTKWNCRFSFHSVGLDYAWLLCVNEVSNRDHANFIFLCYLPLENRFSSSWNCLVIFLVGTFKVWLMTYLSRYYCLLRNNLLVHCCLNSNVLPMLYKSFRNIFTSSTDIRGRHVAFIGQHIYVQFLFLSTLSALRLWGLFFPKRGHIFNFRLCCFAAFLKWLFTIYFLIDFALQ